MKLTGAIEMALSIRRHQASITHFAESEQQVHAPVEIFHFMFLTLQGNTLPLLIESMVCTQLFPGLNQRLRPALRRKNHGCSPQA